MRIYTLLSLIHLSLGVFRLQNISSETQVNDFSQFGQLNARVASLRLSKSYIIVWQSFINDGDGFGIFGKLYSWNGTSLTSEFLINTNITGSQTKPMVCSLENGQKFAVVWESFNQDGNLQGVYVKIFLFNGTNLTTDIQVNTYTLNSQYNPFLSSLDNETKFIVVWTTNNQPGDANLGIKGRIMNSSGSPLTSEFRVNDYTSNNQENPNVASITDTTFIIVWQSLNQLGNGIEVYGKIFSINGTNLTYEFRVNEYISGNQLLPSVCMIESGSKFVVSWISSGQDGHYDGTYARIFYANGLNMTSEFLVNQYIFGGESNRDITSIQNGKAFIVGFVSDQLGNWNEIYIRIFASNGTALTSEIKVNVYINSQQGGFHITQLEEKTFIVVWHSNVQDGSDYGVYFTIFRFSYCNVGEYEYLQNSSCNPICQAPFSPRNQSGFLFCDFPCDNSNTSGYYYHSVLNMCLPYCLSSLALNYSNYLYCSPYCPQGQYHLLSNRTCLSSCLSQEGFESKNYSGIPVCESSCVTEWNFKCYLNVTLSPQKQTVYNDQELNITASLSSNYKNPSYNFSWYCAEYHNDSGSYSCNQTLQNYFSAINQKNASILVPFYQYIIVNSTSLFQICVDINWNFGSIVKCSNITILPTHMRFSFAFTPQFYYTQNILFQVVINQSNISTISSYSCSISPTLPYYLSENIINITPNNNLFASSDLFLQIRVFDGPFRTSLPLYIPINFPPREGALIVNPQSGYYFVTQYTFTAINWVDTDLPLEFRLSYIDKAPIYISDFELSTTWQSYFSISSTNSTNVFIILEIKDSFQALTKHENYTTAQNQPASEFLSNSQHIVSNLLAQNLSKSQLVTTIGSLSSQVTSLISNDHVESNSTSGCPLCSGNGICKESVCKCNSGWIGSKCSVNETIANQVSQMNEAIINQISNLINTGDGNQTSALLDSLVKITSNPNYNSPNTVNQIQNILDSSLDISNSSSTISKDLSTKVSSLVDNILTYSSVKNCNSNSTNQSANTLDKTTSYLDKIANSITTDADTSSTTISQSNYEMNIVTMSVCELNNFTLKTNGTLSPDTKFSVDSGSQSLDCSQNVSVQYVAMNSNLLSCNSSAPKFFSSTTLKIINMTTGKPVDETILKPIVELQFKDPLFVKCSSSCILQGLVCKCNALNMLDIKSQLLSIFSGSKLSSLNFNSWNFIKLVTSVVFWMIVCIDLILIAFTLILRSFEENSYAHKFYNKRFETSIWKKIWVSILVIFFI